MFGTKRKQAGRSGKKEEKPGFIGLNEKKRGQTGAKGPLNEKTQKRRQSPGFGALFGTQL